MNVLLLCADQQRWDALGCAADNSAMARRSWLAQAGIVRTPQLDRLAADGVRFSNATANYPVCLPGRHSFITGLMASQLGLLTNNHYWPESLPVPTLGHLLADAGYRTAAFGKMHWKSSNARRESVPDGRGFRDVVTFADRVNDSPAQENYLASVGQWLTQQVVSEERSLGESEDAAGYVGLVSAVGAGDHFEAWLTERFLQWLETVGRREPFFAVWSVNRPHPPCVVPPEYAGRYQPDTMPLPPELPQGLKEWDPGVRIMEQRRRYSRMSSEQRRMALARYLSNVSFVDDCMGRILDGLRQSGLDRNTLVIFTSDHGDLMGEHGGYTKYNLYESAVRVPLIVRWPGVQHRGWVSDAAVELVDLFPTVLDAAGVQEPAYVAGRSLRPLIAGRSPAETGWRTETFTEFGCRLEWAVRGDQFKLIERPSGDSALYDLAADPLESVNRIHDPQCAEIRDHLRGQMLRRAMELASRYPCGHPAKAIHVADGIYDYCARTMSQRRTPPDYRGRIAVSQAEAAA